MPCAFTSTVAPSFAFDAVLTIAPEAPAPPCGAEAFSEAELVLLLLELPHADSASAAASVGRTNLIDCRMWTPIGPADRVSVATAKDARSPDSLHCTARRTRREHTSLARMRTRWVS